MTALILEKTAFPTVDPFAAFAAASHFATASKQGFRCFWSQPDSNLTFVGVGSALSWQDCSVPEGEDPSSGRFARAEEFMSDLDFEGTAPVALGGFAFAPRQATEAATQASNDGALKIWNGFPRARMVIPELLLIFHHCATSGQAGAVLGQADSANQAIAPVAKVEALVARARPTKISAGTDQWPAAEHSPTDPHLPTGPYSLASAYFPTAPQSRKFLSHFAELIQHSASPTSHAIDPSPANQASGSEALTSFNQRAKANYLSHLKAAISAVEANQLQKVVAARVISQPCQLPPEQVLRNLAQTSPANAVFAFGNSERTFMGATPELLLNKQGARVASLALAGSVPPGQVKALMEDPKELSEHELVLNRIRHGLAEAGVCLDSQAPPEPLNLGTIIHLATHVSGTSVAKTALSLAAALHPSPSIGGVPTSEALQFIDQNENLDRGWYAGPVGWASPSGDGTFFVALRSLLLNSLKGVGYCFAGSGIVEGSSAEKENQETLLKLQTALKSLDL